MRKIIMIAIILMRYLNVEAQSEDSLQILKEFVQVSNTYKQLPLHLQIDYKKTSNIPFSQEDTSTMKADFYLQNGGAYIHFGELEQMINDSMVLIVLKNDKQMILSQTGLSITDQIKTLTGPAIQDTSLLKTAERYAVSKRMIDSKKAMITITNRINVYGSLIPFEIIEMTYYLKEKIPEKIVTTKRSLVPKAERYLSGAVNMAINTVMLEGKGAFYIKEDVTSYNYIKIDHAADKKLPARISDRVMLDSEMNFIPVKDFESYTLIKN